MGILYSPEDITIQFLNYQQQPGSGIIYVNAEDTSIGLKLTAHMPTDDIQKDITLALKWTLFDKQDERELFSTSTAAGSRSALLTITNDYFGRELGLKVSAFRKQDIYYDKKLKLYIDDNNLLPLHQGSITFTIRSKEKKITEVEWVTPEDNIFSENTTALPPYRDERIIMARVSIAGCYNEIITARKVITENDFYVIDVEEKIPVLFNEAIIYFRETETPLDMTQDHNLRFFISFNDSTGTPIMFPYGHETDMFKYTFKGTQLILDIKQMPVQPVEVGFPHIEDNNFMPCKYEGIKLLITPVEKTERKVFRKIEITDTIKVKTQKDLDKEKEQPKEIILFKEGLGANRNKIFLVGGESNFAFTLEKYTVDECKITDPIKKHKKIALYEKYQKPAKKSLTQPEGYKKINIKDDKLDIDINYEYGIIRSLLAGAIFWYIWPKADIHLQEHKLLIETCRHSHLLYIEMYPDIEWTFKLFFEVQTKIVNFNNTIPVVENDEDYKKLAKEAKDGAYDFWYAKNYKKCSSTIGFKLSATANHGTQVFECFALEKAKKIAHFVDHVVGMKDFVDSLFDDMIDKKKRPFECYVKFPKAEVDITWGLGTRDYYTKIGVDGKVTIKLNPLIELNFRVDLLQIGASAWPPLKYIYNLFNADVHTSNYNKSKYGAAYSGQMHLWLGVCSNITVNIDAATFHTNPWSCTFLKGKEGDAGNLTGTLKGYLTAELGASGLVKAFSAEAKIKLHGEGHVSFGVEVIFGFGGDEDGLYLKPKINFSGFEIKILAEYAFSVKTKVTKPIKSGGKWDFEYVVFDIEKSFEKIHLPSSANYSQKPNN